MTATSVAARDFVSGKSPILSLALESNLGHDVNDLNKCEYLVGVDWRKTFPLNEHKTFQGAFANQNVVCRLRDAATIEFLKTSFSVEDHVDSVENRLLI